MANHFVVYNEMVKIGSNAERQIDTVKMSRFACYLSVQTADPSKTIVAQAQVYFAVQTRRAKSAANHTHFEVGKKVRETIQELGGTMPENLPTPESIKRLESKQKRIETKKGNSEQNSDL